MARSLKRELWLVDFNSLIDSKPGQTAKNIAAMFDKIASIKAYDRVMILFDEIDALALDRANGNDLRETGQATAALLKGLDSLTANVMIIATNLFPSWTRP